MIGRNQETYVQRLSHSNAIVQDHRVHGICTLPGVTLLDMIYRLSVLYLETHSVELRHILFTTPIVTSEQFDREIAVTFSPVPSELQWRVTITSNKVMNGTIDQGSEEQHMQCTMFLVDPEFNPPVIHVQDLKTQSRDQWSMDEVYQLARQVNIEHGPFMQTSGVVYQYENQELMCLNLSEQASVYSNEFYAHAAFLDGATFAGSSFRLKEKAQGMFDDQTPYIPFMIERFCIYGPLPDTIGVYSLARPLINDNSVSSPDLISTDIRVVDSAGKSLVEFERLTAKRIRNPHLIQKWAEVHQNPNGVEGSGSEDTSVPELATQVNIQDSPVSIDDTSELSNQRRGVPEGNTKQVAGYLKVEIGKVLGTSEANLDTELGFYQMGLDSLQLINLSRTLENKVKEQLYPTLLFEYSNIKSLAAYLHQHWPEAFTENQYTESKASASKASIKTSELNHDRGKSDDYSSVMLEPFWEEATLRMRNTSNTVRSHVIILCEQAIGHDQMIKECFPQSEVVTLTSERTMPQSFEQMCEQCIVWLQNYMQQFPKVETHIQIIGPSGTGTDFSGAMGALLRTAHAENPHLHGQIITVNDIHNVTRTQWADWLDKERVTHSSGVSEVCYTGKSRVRMVKKYREKPIPMLQKSQYVAKDGVYLITGGLGGLGLMVGRHLAEQGRVTLALVGRSSLGKKESDKISELKSLGADVHYFQADLTHSEQTSHVIQQIRTSLGVIRGIIHCAGVTRDQFILQKTKENISEVLGPKVSGLWYLDEYTRDQPLDFFILFSSLSAVLGNMGQADYACGNAFMDRFAERRQQQVVAGQRSGRTRSINWPLWANGGMSIDPVYEQQLEVKTGLAPLPQDEGMQLFDSLMMNASTQTVVMYGKPSFIRSFAQTTIHVEGPSAAKVLNHEVPRKEKRPSEMHTEDIAIIGVAGRYPMARNVDEFAANLLSGKDCITGFPRDRWEQGRFLYTPDSYYQFGGFIDKIDEFDPLFFNLSPRQAEMMDPQARLFLETAWEACEDAGFRVERSQHQDTSTGTRSVGVFAGVFWNHYELFASELTDRGVPTSLGVSAASVANMVSYCMNFHGPSLAVDTMCSSALTAIHLACESIRNEECEYALAGGVNVITHPHRYMFLKEAQLLSSDGRCRSFGEGGDGYVPGEGAGTVLLTSLSHAEEQGYSIYGVIKGSAINHGGKTSGPTVPDSTAQSEVIKHAFKRSGVDPRTVSYFETHGTGTSLGDPIEVQGLNKALADWSLPEQSCAIGSLKSNIGHLEAAAGVAALTKVLLQMKHNRIFPSLHAERLNPYIPFQNTPFYVEREGRDWRNVKADRNNPETGPLRAGISSFGANGSNAHLIVEEYASTAVNSSSDSESELPVIVPLSAKSQTSLLDHVRDMMNYLSTSKEHQNSAATLGIKLSNLAYTLQVGREHMRYRVAFVVSSLEELRRKCTEYVQSKDQGQRIGSLNSRVGYEGEVRLQEDAITELFQSDEDIRTAIEIWMNKRKMASIAEVWAKGITIDWNSMYQKDSRPTRISLPTYSFQRERYWVPMVHAKRESGTAGFGKKVTVLHSMLHHNRSDLLRGQWYSSQFNGNEPFLSDHVVQGHKLLPAVVQLEMARAAAAHAANWPPLTHSLLLRHVMWSRPLVVGEEPLEVHLALEAEADESLSYKISAASSIESGEAVYSQGRVSVGRPLAEAVQTLDLHAVRSRCTEGQASGAVCYEAFRKLGLEYGPSHQTIAELQWGANEALAQLRLPQALFEGQGDTVLHPGMVDGALQASIALLAGDQIAEVLRSTTLEGAVSLESTALASTTERHGNPPASAPLPFALEEAEVISPCQAHMWAVVRVRPERAASSAAEASVRKLDLELCDSEGQVCIRLRGVTSRVPESREGVLLVQPEWQELPKRSLPAEAVGVEPAVLLCDWAPQDFAAADVSWKQMVLTGALEARYGQAVQAILHHVQQQLAMQRSHRMAVQVVVAGDEQGRRFAGLSGLLRTVRLEHPGCLAQLVEVRPETSAAILTEQLHQCALHAEESHLRWEAGELKRAGWQAVDVDMDTNVDMDMDEMTNGNAETEVKTKRKSGFPLLSPWRDGGVYVITGGAGGLGRIWAREISAQTEGSTLILTGRSPAMPEAVQREMAQLPARVLYEAVDVTDREAVHGLFGRIRQQYGWVNGVLHCAGEIRDSLIRYKTESDWQAVLAPKVNGIRNLEEAIGTEALDVLLLFSSGAAVTGNAGQGDYAAANGYMDAYAVNRNARMKRGECQGRTLSINWPLWEEGGMQLEEEGKQRLWKQHGLRPLGTASGVKALYQAWESGSSQVAVAEGKLSVLRRSLLEPGYSGSGQPIEPVKSDKLESMSEPLSTKLGAPLAGGMTQQEAVSVLTLEVAALLNVGEQDVDPDMDWSEYGLDPVQWSELSRRLLARHGWDISAETLLEQMSLHATAEQFVGPLNLSKSSTADISVSIEDTEEVTGLEGNLEDQTILWLIKTLAPVIGLPESRIEPDVPLEQYGIDSLLIMKMTDVLENELGSLSKTLFFEYQTLRELSHYFMNIHQVRLDKLLQQRGMKPAGMTQKNVLANLQNVSDSQTHAPTHAVMSKRTLLTGTPFEPEAEPILKKTDPDLSIHMDSPSDGEKGKNNQHQDIAIIGMAGRYPGARNIGEFWHNLRSGMDSITEIPSERWDHGQVYNPEPGIPGKTYGRWGGFLDGVDEFDPLFFKVSPREAETMDPQERLFLQCVYETLEDSGYTRQSLSTEKVGVYVGVMYEEYQLYGSQNFMAFNGNPSSIANRVSYFCNFRGPSMAVDTMCSSSLTSIHLACQSLRQNECQVAVAGGVNVSVHPNKYILLSQGKFLSSKGRCESFGQGGDGYVPGEGVGAVLLKPLARAIADGDRIYGVIKGSALNHGGKTNGYTVPNPNAQAEVIGDALLEAGIDPRTISYVEAHGTGTSLGDPIEVAGLTKAFQRTVQSNFKCAIGSAKSNIGHCESAAGIAAVTKVLLQLQHGELAPSLHAEETNPNIDFTQSPFVVQKLLEPWKRPELDGVQIPRRAGVSSFGAGGANAHIIIEEYTQTGMDSEQITVGKDHPKSPVIVVLSARNQERLLAKAKDLLEALYTGIYVDSDMRDLSYTLQVGRESMEERLGLLAASIEELIAKLKEYVEQANNLETQTSQMVFYTGHVKKGKEMLSILSRDEDMEEMVNRWIQKGQHEKLLDLWVQGLNLDWNTLYGAEGKPQRIALPTYPFARERYWIPQQSQGNTISESKVKQEEPPLANPSEPSDHNLMLTPIWEVVEKTEKSEFNPGNKRWLVIGGTTEQWEMVHQIHAKSIRMDAETAVDPVSLMNALKKVDTIDHIIWLSNHMSLPPTSLNHMILAQNMGVKNVFRIIKAMIQLGYGHRPLEWSFLTCQTQSVWSSDPVNPADAGVHGLASSMAQEFPQWYVRLVDLQAGNINERSIRGALSLEPKSKGDLQVHRNNRWYSQELVRLESNAPQDNNNYRYGGIYVVIGGAGGIGEVWSEYMIRTYQARVIWIGRSEYNDEIRNKQNRLSALGAAPEYISANAASEEELMSAYETIKSRFKTINGIVHSAIVLQDGSLEQMTEEQFQHVFVAKLDVSVGMANIFAKENLDFVLFFSSMNSFTRQPGQSNYSAGCMFKDSFAHWLRQSWTCPVKIMNWGFWGSVGRVASLEYRERMNRMGVSSIEGPEAMEALEMLMSIDLTQAALLKTKTNLIPGINMQKSVQVYMSDQPLKASRPVTRDLVHTSHPDKNPSHLLQEMEPLLAKLMWVQLQASGWFESDVSSGTLAELTQNLSDTYAHWIRGSLTALVRYGYLMKTDFGYRVCNYDEPNAETAWQEWEHNKPGWIKHHGAESQIRLVETMLKALPDIIGGKCLATEIMFPDSSMELVGGIYT
ncbi:SDR family NAD(P)-dependent oxidoreductase [Paenibacillus sp. FSL R5-0623]|uniref:SDR family NAD(P)-dependent oxidoreductase n=1 Tax=Paenibacillus sp. FSL R5-0623 TaxID=2921651 RepID=UPI0030DC26D8